MGNIIQYFCHERKNVKYTDSYDIFDLSTSYVQLSFRCYYSISLLVDYLGSALFCSILVRNSKIYFQYCFCSCGFRAQMITFHFPIFRMLYVMDKNYDIKKLTMIVGDKNNFHHKY